MCSGVPASINLATTRATSGSRPTKLVSGVGSARLSRSHEMLCSEIRLSFVSTVRGFRIGDPARDTTYIGPLTRAPQVKVLEAQVKDAVKKGARILAGGKRVDLITDSFTQIGASMPDN